MYDVLIQLLQYGFSTALFCGSIVGFILGYKEQKSWKFLFHWFTIAGYLLLSVSFVLFSFSYYNEKEMSILFIKIISTAFSFFYGIYATVGGFMEVNTETGKKNLSRIGILGILFFCFNATFSVSLEYLKEAADQENKLKDRLEQLEKEKKRKEEFEKLAGNLSFVDQKTGSLQVDFKKFSEDLFSKLQARETELRVAGEKIRGLDTELQSSVLKNKEFEEKNNKLSQLFQESDKKNTIFEKEITREKEISKASEALLKDKLDHILKLEKIISARDAEWKLLSSEDSDRKIQLKKLQEDLLKSEKSLSSRDQEYKELLPKYQSLDLLQKNSMESALKWEKTAIQKDIEYKELRSKYLELDKQTVKLKEELSVSEKLAASREGEIKELRGGYLQLEKMFKKLQDDLLRLEKSIQKKELEIKKETVNSSVEKNQ